eukprot:CAMPEP_0117604014 /NCGR_PEP_ID=MMETSP0784-20121206/78463_1 /TAXON_ID=39447 /ORGANISM="" /LENGTH=371 /DNA_ID=CAMNT_0005407021 /DNA_START=82 /DNA_END=1197 /DNA_ORIENTATION=-
MAPAKKTAVKRNASEQKKAPQAPGPKKARPDPVVAAVMDVIKGADHLSTSCRDMLIAMLPHCLCVAKEERQESQEVIVTQIGQVFEHIRDRRRQAICEADANITELEVAKGESEKRAEERASEQAGAAENTLRVKQDLEECACAKATAAEAVSKAQKADREEGAALAATRSDKDTIDAALNGSLKAVEEEALDAAAISGHIGVFTPLVVKWSLDESLGAALPSVAAKPVAERTSFDRMVLEQMRKSLTEVAQRLAGELEAGAPAAAERAAAIEAAQQALQAAVNAHDVKAIELSNTQAAEQEASAASREAKAGVVDAEAKLKNAVSAREARQREFDGFEETSFARFVELRDKTARVPMPTSAEVELEVGGA